MVKLDSGHPDPGQLAIDIPPVGAWKRVGIRISDLLVNPGEHGDSPDLDRVLSPLVIEATGTSKAKIRLDNIALTCVVNDYARVWQIGADCLLEPVYVETIISGTTEIFSGQISDWLPGDCCGGARAEVVADDVEPERGNVIEFAYETNETVTLLRSRQPLDFSAVSGGTLSFDLLIVQQPDTPAAQDPWKMKVSCVDPCSSGDIPLTGSLEGRAPETGTWQRFSFAIDDLVARGLKLDQVDAPLVIFPSWGNQTGAIFRIDNLVISAPDQ